MKRITNLLILFFLFLMIAITIFFSTSPFAVVQNYLCINQNIKNSTVNICGIAQRPDQLMPFIVLLQNYSNTDKVFCLGENITNGQIDGQKYVTKQIYYNNTLSQIYFKDCTINEGQVCKEGRCLKHNYQVRFFEIFRRFGFDA